MLTWGHPPFWAVKQPTSLFLLLKDLGPGLWPSSSALHLSLTAQGGSPQEESLQSGFSSHQPTATGPAPGGGPSHVLGSSWKWPEEQAQGCSVPAQVSRAE